MSAEPTPELRWIVDRRHDVSPVGDQGGRLTCLAWAATAAHEANVQRPLCVEYLHWAAETPTTQRGSVAGLVVALGMKGQPPADQWEYDPLLNETLPNYSPPSTVIGPFATAAVRMVDDDVESLIRELDDELLPVVALRVSRTFLEAPGGVIYGGEAGTDGHVVTAVGIVETTQEVGPLLAGARLVCVRSSWGPSWGVDGHALVAESAWDRMVDGAFVLEP